METVYYLALRALQNKEIPLLLCGEGGYGLPKPYMSPTDLPTDWDLILKDGLYKLFDGHQDEINGVTLSKVICDLCIDEKGIYCALNILFRQLINEKNKLSPFSINKDAVISVLSPALTSKKDLFVVDYRWMGAVEPNGLWGEIMRISQIIYEDFGIKILEKDVE